MLTRRNFLQAMLATSGAAAFGGVSLAQLGQLTAEPLRPGTPDHRRRFIFCYLGGGWDILVGPDPRDPWEYRSERRGETGIEPAYDRLGAVFRNGGTEGNGLFHDPDLGITLGPACGPIWAHRDKMVVVRGMTMDTVAHEVGRRYFLTGKMPSGLTARGSSVPTEIAAQLHGAGAPTRMPFVPNLAYAVESYNDRHPSYASGLKISSVQDLLDALVRDEGAYSEVEQRLIQDYLGRPDSFGLPLELMPSALNRARKSQIQAEAVLAAQLDKRLRFPQGLNLNSASAAGLLAVQAITENVSTCVSLRLTGSLDTHFDNWDTDQPADQQAAYEVIGQMLTDLSGTAYPDGSGDSWLDYTTVIAFSEFCRTPLINTRGGRDHHPVNACMLWGAGLKGGRVIGASTDIGMLTQGVDLSTGLPDPRGHVIRPEDILGTVMSSAGLDGSVLGREVTHIPALVAS